MTSLNATLCYRNMTDISNQSDWITGNLRSEMKGAQEKNYHGNEALIEKSVSRDHSLVSLGEPRDARK